MTDAEFYKVKKAAIARVKEVAGEHFENFVFIGTVRDPDNNDTAAVSTWDGDFSQAVGLAERLKERFRQDIIATDYPNDPKPDEGDDWKQPI